MTMHRIVLFGLLAATTAAQTARFSSGENRTHLIELYTSEGCSSCPPAEQWLGGLREAPGLWRDFVPVAFHVVYWDHLGWRDRFASKEYTTRQYAYAGQWGSDTVYTPGFVLDGTEWRKLPGRDAPEASSEKAGRLTVEYANDGTCRVTYTAAGDFEVQAALLGGGIASNVKAGENEGRTLHHEFVALALKTARLDAGVAELKLSDVTDKSIGRHALAVWVTRRGDATPVQATGGWLD